MRKGLLDKLKELFIPGWSRSYMYEVFDDPYGEELDRAWEEFQKKKIV